MMSTKAWAQLIEDLLDIRTQYENIRNCDQKNIEFRKGQVDILDYLIGLKELSTTAYQELQDAKNL